MQIFQLKEKYSVNVYTSSFEGLDSYYVLAIIFSDSSDLIKYTIMLIKNKYSYRLYGFKHFFAMKIHILCIFYN